MTSLFSGMLRSVQDCLTLEDEADRLSRNVGNKLPNIRCLTSQNVEDLNVEFLSFILLGFIQPVALLIQTVQQIAFRINSCVLKPQLHQYASVRVNPPSDVKQSLVMICIPSISY